MTNNNDKIFDLYITNVSIVYDRYKQENNRIQTMDELETFLNKLIISNNLDNKFGLIQLLKIPKM